MKRLAIPAALLAVVGLAAPASAADDPPAMTIVRVGYNATGADTVQNTWQEYIDIRNVSDHAVNIAGWRTYDAWAWTHRGDNPAGCNTAVFRKATGPADAGGFKYLAADNPDTEGTPENEGLWLPKGEYIRVYTGGQADVTPDNNWHTIAINKPTCGYHGHYLNNAGDTIRLTDATDKVVAEFSYDFRSGYYVR
jgi:hypothetical protein